MKYMGTVLRDVPQTGYAVPNGIVTATINPLTGLPVANGEAGYNEYFYQETVPVPHPRPCHTGGGACYTGDPTDATPARCFKHYE